MTDTDARDAEARNAEARDDDDTWRPGRTALLAATALVWLVITLWASYATISGDPTDSSFAAVQAALVLPGVIVASLLGAAAVGVLAIGRLGRKSADPDRVLTRLAVGAAAGLVVGVLGAAAVLVAYGTGSFLTTIAVTVAVAAVAGGAMAALRPTVAVSAGLAGALACVALGLIKGYFEGDVIEVVGGTGSATAYVTASGWLQLTYSLLSGFAAGLVPFVYLRRSGLALPWPAYLAAGAAPGLLLFVAEAAVRLGGSSLLRAAGASGALDTLTLSAAQDDRLTHAMIVFFVGSVLAIIAVGRTMRSAG